MKLENLPSGLILLSLFLLFVSCSKNGRLRSGDDALSIDKKDGLEKTNFDSLSKNGLGVYLFKGKTSNELTNVEPLRLPYNWKRVGPLYQITFDHYEPVPGKIIGIWTPNTNIPWSELYSKYGFRGINVSVGQYEMARQSGFEPKYMRIAISPNQDSPDYYEYVVSNFYAGQYYTDEPLNHNCIGNWYHPEWSNYGVLMSQIRNFIHSKYADSSKFVISGYKKCDHFLEAVFTYDGVDNVTFSSYKKWLPILISNECWYPASKDQRDSWTDWKNSFGEKFSSVWISAFPDWNKVRKNDLISDDDIGEYNTLLGHAANLGLKEVWLWCSQDGYNLTYITEFCEAAWRQGWLRKFVKVTEYWIWYRCIEDISTLCDPDNPDVWVIDHYEYGMTWIQEVFPN
ncbi:MAG: hypothetical protein N2252_00970 [Candidatus Kryptonium sp.]|nr:hypothetical protein [Candidatus Kryptonium sp.]